MEYFIEPNLIKHVVMSFFFSMVSLKNKISNQGTDVLQFTYKTLL